MHYNLCCSCKKGKREFCIKCDEMVKSTCKCENENKYKSLIIENVIIHICLKCLEELKADQEISSH